MTTCGGCRGVQLGQQVALEVELFRRTLLHELGLGHGLVERRRDREAVGGGAGGKTELFERGPGSVDEAAQPCLGVEGRVPRPDVIAAGEEVGDPAAADHSGAHAGHAACVLGGGDGGGSLRH